MSIRQIYVMYACSIRIVIMIIIRNIINIKDSKTNKCFQVVRAFEQYGRSGETLSFDILEGQEVFGI